MAFFLTFSSSSLFLLLCFLSLFLPLSFLFCFLCIPSLHSSLLVRVSKRFAPLFFLFSLLVRRADIRFNRYNRTRRRLTRRLFLAKPAFVDTLVELQQTSGDHIHSKPVMDLTPERDPLTVEAFASKQNEQRASAQKLFEDTIVEIDVRVALSFSSSLDAV